MPSPVATAIYCGSIFTVLSIRQSRSFSCRFSKHIQKNGCGLTPSGLRTRLGLRSALTQPLKFLLKNGNFFVGTVLKIHKPVSRRTDRPYQFVELQMDRL